MSPITSNIGDDMKDNKLCVHGYWKDEPEHKMCVVVSLDSDDGEKDDDVFFYTDGELLSVGDTIAGGFIVTNVGECHA